MGRPGPKNGRNFGGLRLKQTSNSVEISWQGEKLELWSAKAIHWPAKKLLLVADTHFGKAATFRKSGIPVPESTSQDDCHRLEELVRQTKVDSLVFLGDFLHARDGRTEGVHKELLDWRKRLSRIAVHLVRGNHDLQSGDPWPDLEIQCHREPWTEFKFDLRHHPVSPTAHPFMAGHIHPGFSLKEKSGSSLRSPCFQVGKNRIILPAFGTFTGIKTVKPDRDDRIFMTDGQEVIEVPTY